jgi:hypothetical protein
MKLVTRGYFTSPLSFILESESEPILIRIIMLKEV